MAFLFFITTTTLVVVFIIRQRQKPIIGNRQSVEIPAQWHVLLLENVDFYAQLSNEDQKRFRLDVAAFLRVTPVTGISCEVEVLDKLLVASSATICLFGFPEWSLFNLKEVLLYPDAFNQAYQSGAPDSNFAGLVGNGHMKDKMILSKKHLRQGYLSGPDGRTVGIHEFAHLVDGLDGAINGFPEHAIDLKFIVPWFELVRLECQKISDGSSRIRTYALENRSEFFAVVTEYFFEKPRELERDHPALYRYLSKAFNQKKTSRNLALSKKKTLPNEPCPCGSGEKAKHCCLKS